MTIPARRGLRAPFDDMADMVDSLRGSVIHRSANGLVLTEDDSGKTVLMDAATLQDYVLPAIGPDQVGIWFEFWVTVTAAADIHTITAQAGDLLVGTAEMAVTGADVEVFHPDVTNDVIISMNGTTTGGIAGSYLYLKALSTTRWGVIAVLNASGAQATPFS